MLSKLSMVACGCKVKDGRLVRDKDTYREIMCEKLQEILNKPDDRKQCITEHIQTLEKLPVQKIEKTNITAMISGPLEITEEQFQKTYVPLLSKGVKEGHKFLVGNAIGADLLCVKWLLNIGMTERITIYLYLRENCNIRTKTQMEKSELINMGIKNIKTDKRWRSYEDRDTAMTVWSDYDIAWERPEEETKKLFGAKYRVGRISGVMKNIQRRLELSK